MDSLTKNSYEKFPIRANFGIDFVPGEIISTVSVTSSDGNTGANDTALIIDWYSPSTPEVQVGVKGGNGALDEDTHIIVVTVGTNLGNTYTRTITLLVKDGVVQDNFRKRSEESLVFLVDFTNELESGDYIVSKIITAVDAEDASDETATVIIGSQLSSPRIYVGVQSGNDGDMYDITIKVTTAAGYKYCRIVEMTVGNE